jgi:hypothetical protein
MMQTVDVGGAEDPVVAQKFIHQQKTSQTSICLIKNSHS